jgi:hypothetical protein
MISYFEAVMKNATVHKQLKYYGTGEARTAVGIFSRTKKADIVMIYVPGGTRPLGLFLDEEEIATTHPDGFTWRAMNLWLNRGVTMVTVDFPKRYFKEMLLGSTAGMNPAERITEQRIFTIEEIIKDFRAMFPKSKIMGYGHSYGSLEMSELAKRDCLDKTIIGSGTWSADMSAENQGIGVNEIYTNRPLLIVHHTNDETPRCKYSFAKKQMERFDSITVTGGQPHLGLPGFDPGPHFFLSQENEVIKNIINWARDREYSTFID